jgi:Zn-dependent protease with chaperone function
MKQVLWYLYYIYSITILVFIGFMLNMMMVGMFVLLIALFSIVLFSSKNVNKETLLPVIFWINYSCLFLFMSSLGERFVGLFLPVRKMSGREAIIVDPILEEICEKYRYKFRDSFRKVKIRVEDRPMPEGYAYGMRTIVLSGTAINSLGRDALGALIAHQIAHLHYKDGLFGLLDIVVFFPLRLISRIPYADLFIGAVAFILNFIDIRKYVSKYIEYRADKFSRDLGYQSGLIELLEMYKKMDYYSDVKFLCMATKEHPPAEMRINALSEER